MMRGLQLQAAVFDTDILGLQIRVGRKGKGREESYEGRGGGFPSRDWGGWMIV